MGLGSFFKKVFGSEPVRVDYGSATNERLLELWGQRSELTEHAREVLIAEAGKRSLELPVPKERAPIGPANPPLEPIVGDAVWVLPPAAVVLRTQGDRAVLVLLPTSEPSLDWLTSLEGKPGVRVEAIVACNGPGGGLLPTSVVAARLGVPAKSVFVLAPTAPGDRPHSSWPAAKAMGERMPKRLDRGFLRLGAVTERPNALIASWNDGAELRVLVGAELRFEDVVSRRASTVVGGLVPEKSAAAIDALLELEEVIFLPEVEGVIAWPEQLAAMGVDAVVARWGKTERQDSCKAEPDRIEAVGRALAVNDWTQLTDLAGALTPAELETVTTGLLLQRGREADAERLLAIACEKNPQSGASWFQRGATAFVLHKEREAVEAYQRATEGPAAEPRAWANLAAIHGRHQRWAESLRCAEAAQGALPSDSLSLAHRLRALLGLGRVDDARTLLETSTLGPREQAIWREAVDRGTPPAPGPDTFPHLASAAARAAEAFRAELPEQAVELLRRGLEFDPTAAGLRLDLTSLLGELGQDEEAERVATEGLPFALAAEVVALRFNRANARTRRGQFDAAREDLLACLELHPAFLEARVQLVSVSIGRRDFDEAQTHLNALRSASADPALVAALEERLALARRS